MQATLISRIHKITNANKPPKPCIEIMADPAHKDRIKWPAVMLAAKRTERVIGRIKRLKVSTNTIKGAKTMGHPRGTKWAALDLVLFVQFINTEDIQSGVEIHKVNLICLNKVKEYGESPPTFKISTNINSTLQHLILPSTPQVAKYVPASVLFCRVHHKLPKPAVLFLLATAQIHTATAGIHHTPLDLTGSKIENSLVTT